MTARPPFDEHAALSPEEREFSARLAALDAGGPSAALDARILAAAQGAVQPRAAAPVRRRTRRWPTAVGAVATLVLAVGLAWQLKPLFDLPPPLREDARTTAGGDEVLAHAEPAAAQPAPPVPEQAVAETAPPPPASTPGPRAATGTRSPARVAKAPPRAVQAEVAATAPAAADEFLDEAVGDHADVASAPAPAPPAPPAAPAPRGAAERAQRVEAHAATAPAAQETDAGRITVSGSRIPRPVAEDAALPPAEWLARIRERRDAGDLDGARDSLRRFFREYPRHRLPDDLRALRAASD